jgi:hypothetical protein
LQERPEFEGDKITSYIDGKETLYYPEAKRAFRICQSSTVISGMVMLVIGAVALIYYIRETVTNSMEKGSYSDGTASQIGSLTASVINAIQITVRSQIWWLFVDSLPFVQILNVVYGMVADALTDRENHRTDTQYEDSLIAKLFMFQFVNSYASFFYVAFVQPYGSNPVTNTMDSLTINLCTIFGTRLTVGNALEMGVPILLAKKRLHDETKGTTGDLTGPELEYVLRPYDVLKGPIKDYAELAIQVSVLECTPSDIQLTYISVWLRHLVRKCVPRSRTSSIFLELC